MPHQQRRTRAAYRKMRLRLVSEATECTWCHVPISNQLPKNHPQKSTADHYVPLSLGGMDSYDNLVPACFRCNSMRGNMTPAAFLAYLGKLAGRSVAHHSREW